MTDERDPPKLTLVIDASELEHKKPEPETPPEDPPNVVKASFGQETTTPDAMHFCMHHNIIVSERRRTVTCRTCGDVIDPFDRLLEYAKEERRWQESRKHERETRARIAALEEEERKIKARTKAASRKDANAAVHAALEAHRERLRSAVYKAREVARLGEQLERLIGGKPEPVETPEVVAERERISELVSRYIQTAMRRGARHASVTQAGMKLLRALRTGLTLEQIQLPDDEPEDGAHV